ncbi:MAG: ATP-grasp domain-containing protein, partial [Gammaproteobacteria bacterium]
MKAILFLGTSLVSAQYLRQSVEALGLRPIFLLRINEYSGLPRRAIEACEYYEADVNSMDDTLYAIRQHNFMDSVAAVTSFLDETFQNVCAISDHFGVAGPDPALAQLTDKIITQKMIPEFCPPSMVFTLSDISEERLRFFLGSQKTCNTFVLKPGISSGAVGVFILNDDTTTEQITQLICHSQIEKAESRCWIIQPRISGHLYSLEGYVQHGQIFFLGFSKRIREGLTEIVNEFPANKSLPDYLQQRCYEAVKVLVQRSNYLNGYFHCEFIVNSETVYFIDGNVGRVAGASIVQQIALAYDKKPVDVIKHVIDLGLFKGINTSGFRYGTISKNQTLSISYCLPSPATVLGVTLPKNMTSFHTPIIDNG